VPAGVRSGPPEAAGHAPAVAPTFAARPFGAAARPQLPNYEASFDALLAPQAGSDDESDGVDDSDEQDEPGAEQLSHLFSPMSARNEPRNEQGAIPVPSAGASDPAAAGLFRDSAATGEVEPVTAPFSLVAGQRDDDAPSDESPVSADEPAASSSSALPASEKTMTRRELRAMLQAEQARRGDGSALVAEPEEAEQQTPAAEPPVAASAPQPAVAESHDRSAVNAAESADTSKGLSFGLLPAAAEPRSAPERSTDDAELPSTVTGHWSRANEVDRQNEAFDQILSRGVGPSGGATTTSALILPSVPSAPPATGPITATGEILVTGSIDLPRGLGSTGQHPDRYDTSEMDRMFDQAEGELNTSDVEPIRASRAVSGHTSTRGVITPPKKSRGRLPLILSITAGVLLVAVVGLLVAGYVLKVF
jgi:hypothetical protein